MPPKAKRAAESDWAQGDRVRTALAVASSALTQLSAAVSSLPAGTELERPKTAFDAICTQATALLAQLGAVVQTTELPSLPADCWGVIMELALERRSMATFGSNGVVIGPKEWLPYRSDVPPARIRHFRLVSRMWNRLASALVRAVVIDRGNELIRQCIHTPAVTFPNVRYIDIKNANTDSWPYIFSFKSALEQNAQRLHGCPPPPGYSRIRVRRGDPHHPFAPRLVGMNDTILEYAGNNASLANRLTTADVVFMSYNFHGSISLPPVVTPFPLRARLIVIPCGSHPFLVTLLAASDEKARKNVCIITGTMPLAHFIWTQCAPLGVRQFPAVSDQTNFSLPVSESVSGLISDMYCMVTR